MKQIILTLAAVALSLSAAFNAAGQSFEYDGLKYSVLSAADKTVECKGAWCYIYRDKCWLSGIFWL